MKNVFGAGKYNEEIFLVRLWRHDRTLFTLFFFFVILFLFLNYKSGVTAAPINQYGMYSKRLSVHDTQTVYCVRANGKPIDIRSFNFAERDLILVPAENFVSGAVHNAAIAQVMKDIGSRTGLDNILQPGNGSITPELFCNRYRGRLCSMLGRAVKNVEIFEKHFVLKNGFLQELSIPIKRATCF